MMDGLPGILRLKVVVGAVLVPKRSAPWDSRPPAPATASPASSAPRGQGWFCSFFPHQRQMGMFQSLAWEIRFLLASLSRAGIPKISGLAYSGKAGGPTSSFSTKQPGWAA